ncbi:adenine deaminase C-terminal domain-containing protein [Methanopyrus sp.]
MRCIGLVRGSIRTEEIVREVTVEDGVVKDDDVAFLVVSDRYGQGSWSIGFVEGELGCALVSTVAHDSHNVVVAGRRLDDVRKALQLVSEVGGCVGAVAGDRAEFVRLDVAGLMSSSDPEEVKKSYEDVLELIRSSSGVDWDPFQALFCDPSGYTGTEAHGSRVSKGGAGRDPLRRRNHRRDPVE